MRTTMPPDIAAAYAEPNEILQAFTNVVAVGVGDENCFGYDLTEDYRRRYKIATQLIRKAYKDVPLVTSSSTLRLKYIVIKPGDLYHGQSMAFFFLVDQPHQASAYYYAFHAKDRIAC